jgi:hypothetical protein
MDREHVPPRLLGLKIAAALLMLFFLLDRMSTTIADPDLWGYLAFGWLFWEQGRFPYVDVFSYVPTLIPWVYHEWLTGVVFYPLYRTLGAPGLQVLKFLLGLAAVGAVFLTARRRGAELLPTALLIFTAFICVSMGYSAVRAQAFTYCFFAVSLYLLEDARLSGRWSKLWLLAPIQIVWCNLHGGFLAGLGLVLLYALGEALSRRPFRPYLVWGLAAGLATLVNPYGLKYWSYLARAVTMDRPEIVEWVSLITGYRRGLVTGRDFFYFLELVAVALVLPLWARWRELTPALVLLFTLYLALTSSRHMIFFALTCAAYLPALLTLYFQSLRARPGYAAFRTHLGRKIPAVLLISLACFFAYRFAGRHPLQLREPPEPGFGVNGGLYYPVGAVDYLIGRRLGGKLLVSFTWGEYCLWKLYPQCLVAIDGRYETVYPADVHQEYFDFLMARPGWRNFLELYPPDLILIELASPVYSLVSLEPGWLQVYADRGSALFRRRPADASGPAKSF